MATKSVLLRLIQQDFEMIVLFDRLAEVGFIGMDYPSITAEIFDLMGISEEVRTDELMDRYTHWAGLSEGLSKTDWFIDWVYTELAGIAEKEGVLAAGRCLD